MAARPASRRLRWTVAATVAIGAVVTLILVLLPGDPRSSPENLIDAVADTIAEYDEATYRELQCSDSLQRDMDMPFDTPAATEVVATDDGGRGATVTVDIQDFELLVVADEDAKGWCLGLIVVCTRKEDIYASTDVRAVTCRNRPRP